jgi:CubicO group peptidase (beta-lactamase class C family)
MRTQVSGLLVLKGGVIRLERYALGSSPATRWVSMSMVKSMTSTLLGAALKDGAIKSLDEPVTAYVPEMRGTAYEAASLRQLLTMTSGAGWSEVYTERGSDASRLSKVLGDQVKGGFIALLQSIPKGVAPGTRFNYSSGESNLIGIVVARATGQRLATYMSDKIWATFGMEADGYYSIESEDGPELGSGRAAMTLRDYGRFGLFIAGGGVARGKAVLPEGWVEEAGSPLVKLEPGQSTYGATGYGYTWWIDPDGSMVAVGFGGQSIYINRSQDLVIATTSCWPQPPYDAPYAIDRNAERLAFRASVVSLLGGS